MACDIMVAKFLKEFKLGTPIHEDSFTLLDLPANSEDGLFDHFVEHGVDERFWQYGTGNPRESDMIYQSTGSSYKRNTLGWKKAFAIGLSNAVASAVNVAGGREAVLGSAASKHTKAQRARKWFINTYPLLGALAASFQLIEDPVLCKRMDISVAAVSMEMKEIYINQAAGLSLEECQFVIAHELLHVGLRHDARARGRDPFFWNVACDFVINAWLVVMQVGEMPAITLCYDPELKGESAESVYDIIVTDLRRLRKLETLRGGKGNCDMLGPETSSWWQQAQGTDLDSFYRRTLMQGLEYHQDQGRGWLPAGLIEEINALAHPPIPWDVELARWFDGHFAPLEKARTYARPSRRQSGAPDIPMPRYAPILEALENRTFGVVLDTSGSMPRNLLARALGALASFSMARDVSKIRLVFCDAHPYDQGYVAPEALAERVKVKGRGGTVLQPGIDLLRKAEDFPKDGPILIITDGGCDRLWIPREHGFLLPAWGRLPFVPKGEVFRVE